jgi:hypothetical protein
VPILSDAGLTSTPLGRAVLGTGVAGEFWPIVVISVFLTGVYGAAAEVILLIAFGGLVALAAAAAVRARPDRVVKALRETVHTLSLLFVVRGASSLLWLRELPRRQTLGLAFFGATGLPLIVAIVAIVGSAGSAAHRQRRRGVADRRGDDLRPGVPVGGHGAVGATACGRTRRGDPGVLGEPQHAIGELETLGSRRRTVLPRVAEKTSRTSSSAVSASR